jgi:hypothetical protein
MPHVAAGPVEMRPINQRLRNRSTWPVLCKCLPSMRTPLYTATIHVKEVREFPFVVSRE